MQVMFTAFLQMNTKNTGIQSVQADQIGRTYPPLLPKEEEIIDDLREITAMEYVVQVIMIIVCVVPPGLGKIPRQHRTFDASGEEAGWL